MPPTGLPPPHVCWRFARPLALGDVERCEQELARTYGRRYLFVSEEKETPPNGYQRFVAVFERNWEPDPEAPAEMRGEL